MVHPKDKSFSDDIKYYCKDCEKLVDAKKAGRKYVFICPICKTKNVAFGTEKSLKNFFHIEEEEEETVEKEKKKEDKVEEKK